MFQFFKNLLILVVFFIPTAKADPDRSLDDLVTTLVAKNIAVIGIGETHLEKNRKQLYLNLLSKLNFAMKQPFCFLYELPGGDNRPFRQGWPVEEAMKMNIPTFGVDEPFIDRQYDVTKDPANAFNERDRYMAERIYRLFNSGICQSALLVNGAKHYQNFVKARESLKSQLQTYFNFNGNSYFIKRIDYDSDNSGATEWKWQPQKSGDFDSTIIGK